MKSMDVVIVTYNSAGTMSACLDSILGCDAVGRIVVVDNGSTDETVAGLRGADGIRLVQTGRNLGFARAANIGAELCDADKVLFLNPDAIATPDALSALQEAMDCDDGVVVVAPSLSCAETAGTVGARKFSGIANRVVPHVPVARRLLPVSNEYDWSRMPGGLARVDWVWGACMLVRRAFWDRVGGFDERFFMYSEDEDLCRRARLLGGKVMFARDVEVTHVGAASSAGDASLPFSRQAASQYLLLRKWRGRAAAALFRWGTLGAISLQGVPGAFGRDSGTPDARAAAVSALRAAAMDALPGGVSSSLRSGRRADPSGMRVAMIDPWGEGGIHTYSLALCDALADAGVEAHLITTRRADAVPRDQCMSQRRVLEGFSEPPSVPPLLRRMWSLHQHLMNVLRLLDAVRAIDPDVVHVQWPLTRFGSAALRWLGSRYPLVITAHNSRPHDCEDPRILGYWRRVFGACRVVVCHSERTRSDMALQYSDELGRRSLVVPHGFGVPSWRRIAPPNTTDARRTLGLPDGRIVLFFGAIRPYKGLDVLLDAWPRVVRAIPDAWLVIAGQTGHWAPYEEQIRTLGIAPSVIARVGWVNEDDIPGYMSSANVVALPYRHIDGSSVATSAVFHGTPVVLSDISGFRALYTDDEASFSRAEPDCLADALIATLEAPEVAALRAVVARERSALETSWATSAKMHERIYEHVRRAMPRG